MSIPQLPVWLWQECSVYIVYLSQLAPAVRRQQLIAPDGFPLTTAARTAKTGLAIGVTFGLVQDALGAANGRRPGYVDFAIRRGRKKADAEQHLIS